MSEPDPSANRIGESSRACGVKGPPTGRYDLATAAADLAAAGLLRGVWISRNSAWQQISPSEVVGNFHGACLDSRQSCPGQLFVGLPGPRVDGGIFAAQALGAGAHALIGPGALAAVVNNRDGDVVSDPKTVRICDHGPEGGVLLVCSDAMSGLTCLAGCWRLRMPAQIIGITGSNGKTTTKDFLAAILSAAGPVHATSGNLNSAQGVPLTLLSLLPYHRFAVVEMGATGLGHIAALAALARPTFGIITNASVAHLAEFGSLEMIIMGKGELVAALPEDGAAVLNADSPGYDRWLDMASCPTISWGQKTGDHRWQWSADHAGKGGCLIVDGVRWDVPLPGHHNGANLCAAILAARTAGLGHQQIRAGLESFHPSPHRAALRRLGERFILDDCYNANPESMRYAARMLCDLSGGKAWAVLGGMAELGADSQDLHLALGRNLAALDIDVLIAVGEASVPLASGYAAVGKQVLICRNQDEAAALLAERSRPGDRILVKGSRAMAMERVIDALIEHHGWTEGPV